MNKLIDHAHYRGRGARSNRSGRFEDVVRVTCDDGWDPNKRAPQSQTELTPLTPRTVITYNQSPDLPFDRTINPYKGCEHGCIYCYARPKHAYLGLSAGVDFERRIFWKPGAADVLARELDTSSYRPAVIVLGGDTDPYQPAEKTVGTTRALLQVLWERRHPCSIVTKSALIQRDLDILEPMAKAGCVQVAVSITTLDRTLARAMEPRAATPARRLETISALADAGVPVRVMAAPMIPGLNDAELEAILGAARTAGASYANYVLLRLPLEIADLFQEWLEEARPTKARKVMSLLRGMREGHTYDARWFVRGRGVGPYAALLHQRFRAAARQLGLDSPATPLRADLFRRRHANGQRDLFSD